MKKPRRFWSKVDVGGPDECWEWLASKSQKYGKFRVHGKMWRAHRVVWVLTYGPIPEGLFVCHHCDNPRCCNPYHLFLGTNSDNMIDAAMKGHVGKLTKVDVRDIRKLYLTGKWTQEEIADVFGVRNSTISKIISRKLWKKTH